MKELYKLKTGKGTYGKEQITISKDDLLLINKEAEGSVAVAESSNYTLEPVSGTNKVQLLKDGIEVSEIDLTRYVDDTNLARLVSGTLDANGMATFTRDDATVFTIDLSNIQSETSFSDEDNVEQYSSNTDKRIGYHDLGSKVYYPSLLVGSSPNYFKINPSNSFYRTSYGLNSGSAFYAKITLPSSLLNQIKFTVCVFYRLDNNISIWGNFIINSDITKSTIPYWKNPIISSNNSTKGYDFTATFTYEDNLPVLIIGTDKLDVDSGDFDAVVSDVIVQQDRTSSLHIWNDINVRATSRIVQKNTDVIIPWEDMIPKTSLNILDSDGALLDTTDSIQLGEYLEYNNVEKKINVAPVFFSRVLQLLNSFRVINNQSTVTNEDEKIKSLKLFNHPYVSHLDSLDTTYSLPFELKTYIRKNSSFLDSTSSGINKLSEDTFTISIYSDNLLKSAGVKATDEVLVSLSLSDEDILNKINFGLYVSITGVVTKHFTSVSAGTSYTIVFDTITYDSLGNVLARKSVTKFLFTNKESITKETLQLKFKNNIVFLDDSDADNFLYSDNTEVLSFTNTF